jgi:hypothetical protein
MSKILWRNLPFAFAIALTGSIATTPAIAQTLSEFRTWTCDELWYARNSEYEAVAYCFKSARGKREFSNLGCFRNESQASAAMGSYNRAYVSKMKKAEKLKGC